MSLQEVNVVWLKRDLRTQDHEPLYKAEQSGLPYFIINIYEPHLIEYPDCSLRHLRFIYQSIDEMNQILSLSGQMVHSFYGEAVEVFLYLSKRYKLNKIYSFQESGTEITWKRDRNLARIFKSLGAEWEESQRDGVIRGIKNRKSWDKAWYSRMAGSQIVNNYSKLKVTLEDHKYQIHDDIKKDLNTKNDTYQSGGQVVAWRYLNSFMKERGEKYHFQISKPELSRTSCSRLSPYLAWGNLSVKQTYQFIKSHENFKSHKRAFSAMLSRMKWRCHFIQKFEVECRYEYDFINRGYQTMPFANKKRFLEAWEKGATGYPMVDASMRCLKATGWINFRMRAMLVSFLCHHLDHDFRLGHHFMARQFLDYEPGIHYPQFQMQAGTTGVNTVRIYNPEKQVDDHDPEAIFIKKWIPELRELPIEFAKKPYLMTELEQNLYGVVLGKDYPNPIVDLKESGKIARDKIWGFRKNKEVQLEQKRILRTHTRRSRPE